LQHLPAGYEEGMLYGMIAFFIPLSRYPKTYNKKPLAYACLASQKNYMALYLNNIYSNPETERWFRKKFLASGKNWMLGNAVSVSES